MTVGLYKITAFFNGKFVQGSSGTRSDNSQFFYSRLALLFIINRKNLTNMFTVFDSQMMVLVPEMAVRRHSWSFEVVAWLDPC